MTSMNVRDPKLMFSIQTMEVKEGKKLKAMEPDENGVYRNIPLIVLGAVSRNMAYYEVESMVNSMANPGTRFYKNLTEGNLEGEWCHPMMTGDDKLDISRLITIDRTKVSHYFTRVFTKATEDNKYVVVYGDVVPYGPFGSFLDASFRDPKRNTAFSLRSLTSKPEQVDGVYHKNVLCLVTIDAVDGCGYEYASKRFALDKSVEGIIDQYDEKNVEFSVDDLVKCERANEVIGVETITHQQVLDMLKTDKVIIKNQVMGVFDSKTKSLITDKGRKSIFHAMYR